jgi:hypothetical protein
MAFVVNFVGGLASQILCAASYFYLKSLGQEVFADFSYFSQQPARLGSPTGTPGQRLSHWPYSLEWYGLGMDKFQLQRECGASMIRISDYPQKWTLADQGFKVGEISSLFNIPGFVKAHLDNLLPTASYTALHIRRGDFSNTGVNLTPELEIVELALRVTDVSSKIVVSSDEELSASLKDTLSRIHHSVVLVPRDTQAVVVHSILRRAKVLVGSNSGFTFTAGRLSEGGGVAFIPNTWYSGIPDMTILQSTRFSVLTR